MIDSTLVFKWRDKIDGQPRTFFSSYADFARAVDEWIAQLSACEGHGDGLTVSIAPADNRDGHRMVIFRRGSYGSYSIVTTSEAMTCAAYEWSLWRAYEQRYAMNLTGGWGGESLGYVWKFTPANSPEIRDARCL